VHSHHISIVLAVVLSFIVIAIADRGLALGTRLAAMFVVL
jgi:hypothetical protein